MRILHLIPSIDVRAGGPITALIGLATAQSRAGLEVTIVSTYRDPPGPPSTDALRSAGVAVHLVGPTRGRLERHPELAATVRRHVAEADVVHIHAMWEELQHQAARAARRLGKPYVITPHGMLTPWSLGQSQWPKRLFLAWRVRANLDRAAAIHYTTEQEREETAAALRLRTPPLVQRLGLDLSEFDVLPPRGSFRSRYPQIGDRPLVVFLGRIHPGKGLEHLVPALAMADVPEAMLAVVGPDSENFQATIERAVDQHGLRDRVIFTGMLRGADRVAALADADLFCLPSDHENFGMAIIEALAAGVPALISDHVAIWRDVVAAGVGAATAPRADALAPELRRWLTDKRLATEAANQARAFVKREYDLTRIAQRWKEHYSRLAAR
jgi:glycosyltransferase involved in cell wall biosynthesis